MTLSPRPGDIIHLTVLGRRMIVIHSYDVVQELLNKRPSTTAGRNMGYMYTHMYVIKLRPSIPNTDTG